MKHAKMQQIVLDQACSLAGQSAGAYGGSQIILSFGGKHDVFYEGDGA